MRYLTKDDYRVLTAIELGMRNHSMVPVPLIVSIAKLRHGGSSKILSTLLRHKLVAHEAKEYNGYRLSYLGYDILALRTLLTRGTIVSVGSQIGVGKESDIFEALNEDGEEVVLKIHRLGRTSFRAVRKQRDYMENKCKSSWLYMSRLAAMKEFAFMKALYANGFPTPIPFDNSRHIVAMSRIEGFPMAQIKTGQMQFAENIFSSCAAILERLAVHGLIHCDFNEFNLMVNNEGKITMIDFPQMVSTNHPNASELFDRDMHGLIKFFAMKMRFVPADEQRLRLCDIIQSGSRLDEEVMGCGISQQDNDAVTEFFLCKGDDDEGCDEEGQGGIIEFDDGDVSDMMQGEGVFAGKREKESVSALSAATNQCPSPPASAQDQSVGANEQETGALDTSPKLEVSDADFEHVNDEGEEDLWSSEDEDQSDAVPASIANGVFEGNRQDIRRAVKRESAKGRPNKNSRNHTKTRNKYGKIDRSERGGASSSFW